MKKGIITGLAALVAASASLVYAQTETNQPPTPPGHHWLHKMDRLSQELNLTEEQKTQVQAIFDDFRQKMGEAKTNVETQLQSVLTPEQYQKLHDERWNGHKHHHGWRHHQGQEDQEGENTETTPNNNATQ